MCKQKQYAFFRRNYFLSNDLQPTDPDWLMWSLLAYPRGTETRRPWPLHPRWTCAASPPSKAHCIALGTSRSILLRLPVREDVKHVWKNKHFGHSNVFSRNRHLETTISFVKNSVSKTKQAVQIYRNRDMPLSEADIVYHLFTRVVKCTACWQRFKKYVLTSS